LESVNIPEKHTSDKITVTIEWRLAC